MNSMEVKEIRLERLKPYAGNPRKNHGAIAAVARSIQEFGFRQPIVTDDRYEIIVGHTRYFAAKQLGLARVPVHIAENLPPEKVKAYRIADNALNDLADWDYELLALEVADLDERGFDAELLFLNDDILTAARTQPGEFQPGDEASQGALDRLTEKTVKCPHCGESFSVRGNEN